MGKGEKVTASNGHGQDALRMAEYAGRGGELGERQVGVAARRRWLSVGQMLAESRKTVAGGAARPFLNTLSVHENIEEETLQAGSCAGWKGQQHWPKTALCRNPPSWPNPLMLGTRTQIRSKDLLWAFPCKASGWMFNM